MHVHHYLWVIVPGGPGTPGFCCWFWFGLVFFLYKSVTCQWDYFQRNTFNLAFCGWKKKLTILPKAFYALVHWKEPSLSLFPLSVEFILYKVSRFFFLNCKCRFCWLEITTSVSPVLWEMPSLFGTLKLLNVDLSLGGNQSDCEWCQCVLSAWRCFECGIIVWCSCVLDCIFCFLLPRQTKLLP